MLEHMGGWEEILADVLRKVSQQDDLKTLLFTWEEPEENSKIFVLYFGISE